MRIGHFVPSYTPMLPHITAQSHRERDVLVDRQGFDYRFWSEACSDITKIRNRALKAAIEMECDYLCMQDSDIFSKSSIGAIAVMLATMMETDACMVAAICGLRREPAVPNVYPAHAGRVYEAEKVGTGLVLIDCKQAQELERPWFMKSYNEDGTEIDVGEDIWFCKRIHAAGKKLVVDGRVPTTHARQDLKTLDYPGAAAAAESAADSNPAVTGDA